MQRQNRGNTNDIWPWIWPYQANRESDLFDRSFFGSKWPRLFQNMSTPTVDMYETDKEVVVEADVPGFNEESLSIQLTSQNMTIRGKMEETRDRSQDGYHMKEREYGRFSRTITFPMEVVQNEARASYKDGVLKVVIPKQQKGQGFRDVPIQRE
jgi:HSP20 family protein